MGENYSDNLHSIKNTGENPTLKQMFEISEQLILEQSDEIFGVSQISWESSPWEQFSLVDDEEVISLSHAKVYVFSDSVLCLGKMNWNPASKTENRWNSSGIFSQDSTHWSLSAKSKSSWTKWATQHNSKDVLSSCRCSMTSYGELQTMTRKVLLTPHLCLYLQKNSHQDDHFSDLDQKRSGILLILTDHKENGAEPLELMMINFGESGHPRVHCPEERSKAKVVENYRYTSALMGLRLKLFFEQLFLLISWVSTEQSQICVRNTKVAM